MNAPWPVCIFAYNEEALIAACLDSLRAEAADQPLHAVVMINGCTDRTEQIVREYATRHPFVTPVVLGIGDKANAWNTYIFEHAPADADIHFFMHGDVEVLPGSLAALAKALTDNPTAHAAAAMPKAGRSQTSFAKMLRDKRAIAGNLYALSGRTVQHFKNTNVRLPIGIFGEDGLIGTLVKYDLDPTGPCDPDRVVCR